MKRKVFWVVAGVVVIAFVITAARADFKRGRGWCSHGWHRREPLSLIAHDLKLSDAQVSQVRSIWIDEQPAVTSPLKELISGVHQLAEATAGGKFDEDKVQAIATTEGNAFAKLLMEKERLKSRVYITVLNEEQRQSADRLQQRWLQRLDHTAERLGQQSR